MSVVVGIGIGQNTVFQANTIPIFRKVAQAPRLSVGSLHKAATIEVARPIVRIASKKGKRKERKGTTAPEASKWEARVQGAKGDVCKRPWNHQGQGRMQGAPGPARKVKVGDPPNKTLI